MNETPEQSDKVTAGGMGRSRLGRGLTVLSGLFAVLIVLAVAAVLIIPGREFAAPQWARDRIDTRLTRLAPMVDISFGAMVLVVEDGWRPRVRLRDVDVRTRADHSHLISLAQLESTLSLPALVRGQAQPRDIRMSGALLSVRRALDGSFNLALGEMASPVGSAPDLPSLIDQVDAALQTEQLKSLRSVGLRAVTIRYEDQRSGTALTVDGGRLRLNRKGDVLQIGGDFALLSGRAYAATLEMNSESRIGSQAVTFGVSFADMAARDIAVQAPALAWLGALRAPISGSMRSSVGEDGTLGPLNATLQIGEGVLQPNEETRPIPFSSGRSYFTYTPQTGTLRFDELAVQSEWGAASAEGTATLLGLESGWPDAMLAQFHFADVVTNPDGAFDEAITLPRALMDLRLSFDPFRVDLGQAFLDLPEAPMLLRGHLTADREGWKTALDVSLARADARDVVRYWPHSLKEQTRTWISDNILAGQIHDAHMSLRSLPEQIPVVHLGFKFTDATVKAMKPMPPIEEGAGHMTIEDNRLVVVAENGYVIADQGGRVDVSGTSFIVPDVRIKEGPAEVRLRTDSTVTAALALLDREPFQFLTKAGQPVALADGRAVTSSTFDLRLKKGLRPDEVIFDVAGNLRSIASDAIVPGRKIAASNLTVSATNDLLVISGEGRLGRVPFNGSWSMPIGQPGAGSRVEAVVELSERFIDEFRIGLPAGSVGGVGEGRISIDLARDAPARFDLRSNLRGLGLRLDAVGWSKASATSGDLRVAGTLGAPPDISSLSLSAPGIDLSGKVKLKPDGGLDRADLQPLRVGNWLNSAVTLTGRGRSAPPAIALQGGTLDMRAMPSGGGRGTPGQGGPVAVAVDRLQVTEGIALSPFNGEFTTQGGLQGTFSAQINGAAPVAGRLVPQKNGTAFQVNSDDAGRVLAAAGLLNQVRGGDFTLSMVPDAGEGTYRGQMAIRDTRLLKAPAIAELLNAISIVGLLEQMNAAGILFTEVDANFRLTPAQVIVTRSSAIGPSMGLSLDGYYNLGSETMDMQGVLSPIYLLNGIGSVLTRKGEGLIGFNFNLTGKKSAPKVQVNPFSALTPGMFREIFRRPPPKATQ